MTEQEKPSWRIEILAGVTTFLTMGYIVVVNPGILSSTGMPLEDVFFATCVASFIATVAMALAAKYPFALAPGMGINAFFAFTVCIEMKVPWQTALSAVLVSGLIFLVLSLLGLREKIIASVPPMLVRAISAGIGLFIAFIGLEHAGIVVDHPATLVAMGNLNDPIALVSISGIILTAGLIAANIPGAVLIGIVASTVIAVGTGVASAPESVVQIPSLPTQTMGAAIFSMGNLFTPEMILVVFTMLFIDLFDTMGTLLALGYKTGRIDKSGRLPRAGAAFSADAIGTITGALLGTSTVTTYIESAAGVAVGGKTGRTALVTAGLFLLALFFFPLVKVIPPCATAPALIIVGALMFSAASDIDWKDPIIAIPALATILIMPATFSISNGLGAGFLLFTITHLAARRFEEIKPATCVIAAAFIVYFSIGLA